MLSESDKWLIREMAKHRCEYCLAPEVIAAYPFHLEHIVPQYEGGETTPENIAVSCVQCNRAKWYHTTGVDPLTGKETRLFNPRRDQWSAHFRIERKIHILGKTPIGRATEARLNLNQPRQLEARKFWVKLRLFP